MDIKEILSKMTLEEKASMVTGYDFWHFKGVERLGVPSLMVCDGPHGLRKQENAANADMLGINDSITAVCFPSAAGLAASFDKELVRQVGDTLGRECQAENISVLLGPGNNIKRSPLCGRNFEYFSEDPYLSGEMAAAHIQGVQGQGVGTSMKHFCGNNQETRRMSGDSIIDERTLREIYLASFEKPVKEACPKTIMCAYNQVNGTFLAENKRLLDSILREEWGFSGAVITDWGAGKDQVKGVEAGLNIQMPGNGSKENPRIVDAVKNGILPEERLDKMVEDVLELIDWCTSHHREGVIFEYERDHAFAAKAAEECAVLLKNEDEILPLKKSQKVAVIGEFAQKPRFQGSGSSHIKTYKVDCFLDAVSDNDNITFSPGYSTKEDSNAEFLLKEAAKTAKDSDVAVIFAGLPDAYESEGFDRTHIKMPDNQVRLIEEVVKEQPNTVVVLHNGSAVEMPWIGRVKAVLEMYLAGEGVGKAEAALLYGDRNPSGKLAETFPKRLEDNPSYLSFPGIDGNVCYQEQVYVGYRYYDARKMDVLFPFGHGLSYTTFSYSDLRISKEKMTDKETVTVTCTVRNTGAVVGKEAVQLYVGPSAPEKRRVPVPVRQLKGFEKISLEPGEEKTVAFILDERAFAHYEVKNSDWFVESGDYTIYIGSSSRDIRLEGTVKVTGTKSLSIKIDAFTPIGDILLTEKGKQIIGPMLNQAFKQQGSEGMGALGEGAEKMAASMAMEMPIGAIVSFGVMTGEQLQGLLQSLQN